MAFESPAIHHVESVDATVTACPRGACVSLREFGYPDCFAQQIADTWAAMKEGKKGEHLPHGIIGRFAERQLREHFDMIDKLPRATDAQ